jgi:hypothetical protein
MNMAGFGITSVPGSVLRRRWVLGIQRLPALGGVAGQFGGGPGQAST